MTWTRVGRGDWRLTKQGFDGRARLNETNSGVIAIIRVENTEFEMELVNDREFFEVRSEAEDYLKDRMRNAL